jgi:flavin reductase (DIM6/NTAB) family NADH-FMN oxidoreductase RutF
MGRVVATMRSIVRLMEFDPATHSIAECYRMLIGLVVPRPIAVVGTRSPDGSSTNLAPFSFFTGGGSVPMTLLFCPANHDDGSEKDSLRNAKPIADGGSGEFTVSICTHAILNGVVACSEPLDYAASEFDLAGLKPRASSRIAAPGVAESPATFECRTLRVIRLAEGRSSGGNIVIGEVVWLHIDDAVLDARGRVAADALQAIGRMGGIEYCATARRGSLPFGRAALEQSNPFA